MDQGTAEKEILLQIEEAYRIRGANLHESIKIAEDALIKSKALGNKKLIALSLSRLSLFYMITGEYAKSTSLAEEAIVLFKEVNDERGIADAKYNIASVLYKTDDLHLGLRYLFECLTIYKQYEDHHNQAKVLKSIGTIYEYFDDQKRAIEAYKKCLKASKKVNNLNLESNVLNPLSGIYLNQNEVPLARETIERSIQLKEQTGDTRGLAFALYGRGKVFIKTEEYQKAEKDLMDSMKIHRKFGENLGIGMCYIKFGVLYLATNEVSKAISTLKEAMDFGREKNISLVKTKGYHLLYKAYKELGNSQEALKSLEEYNREREIVTSKQTHKVIENYELITKMESLEKETKLKLEKAEILKEKNIAEQANKVKENFLSTMSHEIRTPLNAIITIASLLGENANDKDRELIHSLRFSSNNLLQIINDILDFSKLEADKFTLDPQPTDLRELLSDIRSTYNTLAVEKGLTLSLNVEDTIKSSYFIDQTRFTQILGNLVSNAIKFTGHGSVDMVAKLVRCSEKKDVIKFEVQDTGTGIKPNFQERIFDSFTQFKSVTKRKAGGSGLGLAIVKKLVELYDSNITLESEYGVGSRFFFELELERSNQPIQVSENIISDLNGKQILIAEDNVINAMVARKLLTNWGINTAHAKNGIEAVEMSKKGTYDYILLDIHMPEMDGFEAIEEIRKAENPNAQTPIFALTADITVKAKHTDRDLFDDFLLKPIEKDKLYLTLKNYHQIF